MARNGCAMPDANVIDPVMQSLSTGGSTTVKVFLLLTVMSFSTAILMSMTSFTRIMIVMGFLRQAMGTPQLPPNQVLIGLSLFLTAFIMAPTATRVADEAVTPYMEDQIDYKVAADRGSTIMKSFLLSQTRPEDLKLFFELSGKPRPKRGEEIPLVVAAPAFMVSELTTAFQMGLYLFIPMVLIDLLVSGLLMSLGMMMVPPTLVALPLKVGVFLLADGWHLVVRSLARSFG